MRDIYCGENQYVWYTISYFNLVLRLNYERLPFFKKSKLQFNPKYAANNSATDYSKYKTTAKLRFVTTFQIPVYSTVGIASVENLFETALFHGKNIVKPEQPGPLTF